MSVSRPTGRAVFSDTREGIFSDTGVLLVVRREYAPVMLPWGRSCQVCTGHLPPWLCCIPAGHKGTWALGSDRVGRRGRSDQIGSADARALSSDRTWSADVGARIKPSPPAERAKPNSRGHRYLIARTLN
eukprot:9050599-Pyramimonas_sp.AAC.1